jgi:hypothetical protein
VVCSRMNFTFIFKVQEICIMKYNILIKCERNMVNYTFQFLQVRTSNNTTSLHSHKNTFTHRHIF